MSRKSTGVEIETVSLSDPAVQRHVESIASPEHNPEQAYASTEGRERLHKILSDTLSRPQMAVIQGLYFDHLTAAEVAHDLNVSEAAVDGLRKRALATLRTLVGLESFLKSLTSPSRV